ncbi:hypothetical protein JCM10449v2_003447 [Rhodotorula kratochvilovae]
MTTATLKVKVRRTTGIPLSKQHIFYKGNELRNAHTLARAGVPPGAVLRLEGLLLLRSSPSTVKVAFESSAVVDDIVTTLSRHCAPLGAYPLSLGGKTLLGGHSVALFGYGPHNVVKIAGMFLPSFPLPVTLATGGKITPIVNTFDSVQLDLFIGDIKLDEKKSVRDVGLNVKSNVHVHVVQHNLVQIYVKNLAGKLIPVEVDSGRTVADVKGIIEEQEDIPRSERRLTYDSGPLAMFNFLPSATLNLVLRLGGGASSGTQDHQPVAHYNAPTTAIQLPPAAPRPGNTIGDGNCLFNMIAQLALDLSQFAGSAKLTFSSTPLFLKGYESGYFAGLEKGHEFAEVFGANGQFGGRTQLILIATIMQCPIVVIGASSGRTPARCATRSSPTPTSRPTSGSTTASSSTP